MADALAKLWAERFTLRDLEALKHKFESLGELREPDFVEFIMKSLREKVGTPLECKIEDAESFFLMVDANSSGTVNWDEFSSYLFLPPTSYAKTATKGNEHEKNIFPASLVTPPSHIKHADEISTVIKVKRRFAHLKDVFLTASQDGKVLAWNSDSLKFHASVVSKQGWVTDIVHMKHSHRLGISTATGVKIYDILNREVFGVRHMGDVPEWLLAHAIPQRLAYHFDDAKQTEYLLIAGSDGMITSFSFHGPSHLPLLLDPQNAPGNVEFSNFTKIQRIKHHKDHVTHLAYPADLGLVVSSSLDGTVKIFEIDRLKKVHTVFRRHEKGSTGFVYNSTARVVASCGVDRVIQLWSPMSPENTAELHGHNASIKQLQSLSGTNEIISLDVHGHIKIWDIRQQHCLQNLFAGSNVNKPNVIFMDNTLENLFTGGRSMKLWPISRGGLAQQTKEYRPPMSHALYNQNFCQVITVTVHDNTFRVWDIQTGKYVSSVATAEQDATRDLFLKDLTDITALALDHGHRRLILGTHKGDCVTVWNTSNGQCLRVFEKRGVNEKTGGAPAENIDLRHEGKARDIKLKGSLARQPSPVKTLQKRNSIGITTSPKIRRRSTIRSLKSGKQDSVQTRDKQEETCAIVNFLVVDRLGGDKGLRLTKMTAAACWNKKIYLWSEDDENTSLALSAVQKLPGDLYPATDSHEGDIRCIAYCSPCYIATGCTEGKVILWNTTTNSIHFVQKYPSTVVSLLWAERLKLLIAGCESGSVSFLNARDGALYSVHTPSQHSNSLLSCFAKDSLDTYLVAGDSLGGIRVWNVCNPLGSDSFFSLVTYFQAHEGGVGLTSVDIVENAEWPEIFLLSAGRDGYACLWTIAGVPLGYFGQEIPWALHDPTTYFSNSSTPLMSSKHLESAYTVDPDQPTLDSKRMLKKIYDLESTIEENLKCTIPSVGDVWQYENTRPEDGNDESSHIIDVITIIRVDLAVGLVVFFHGHLLHDTDDSSEGTKGTLPLSNLIDFRKRNEDGSLNYFMWKKNSKLSAFVGRVHMDQIGREYKVMYVRYEEFCHEWSLIDTNRQAHPLVSHDMKINSRHRSMSLFKALNTLDLAAIQRQAEETISSEEECNSEIDCRSDKEETVHEEPEPKKKERVKFTNTKLFPINRPRKEDHVHTAETMDGPKAESALSGNVTKLKKYDLAQISTIISSFDRTGKTSNWQKLKVRQLREIVALLTETQDLDQFFLAVMKQSCKLLEADRGTLWLYNGRTKMLTSKTAVDVNYLEIPSTKGIVGHVFTTGETINIEDAYNDKSFDQSIDKQTHYRTKSVLCVPIIDEQRGERIGVLQLINKTLTEADYFTASDVHLARVYCAQLAIFHRNISASTAKDYFEKNLSLEGRKGKWYDQFVGKDMDLLLHLQNMSASDCATSEGAASTLVPTRPKVMRTQNNAEVLEVIRKRRVFRPTRRKRVWDKRIVHSTDAVTTVYKRKDLKKVRMERMKDVVGMQYSLPEL
jgi:WD40 repeat protein/putative methionine-R-sulfoxide reductase with GAF domain